MKGVDENLEFRILVELDDDWVTFGEFIFEVESSRGTETTMSDVAAVVRAFVEEGLMTLGSLARNDIGWAAWSVDLDEAMRRIADGYAGQVGYRSAPDRKSLASTEVMRACITEHGEQRLAELEARGFRFERR